MGDWAPVNYVFTGARSVDNLMTLGREPSRLSVDPKGKIGPATSADASIPHEEIQSTTAGINTKEENLEDKFHRHNEGICNSDPWRRTESSTSEETLFSQDY